MLNAIRSSWGWTGIVPVAIVESNPFGNVIVGAADGAFWRICPEELYCRIIARDADEFSEL